jgi:DNA-binding NarL/FixJ family response regulator
MTEAVAPNGGASLVEAPRSAGSEARAPTAAVSVLIVDDSAPFRRAAQAVVEATPGFVAVGEAASGEEALLAMEDLDPWLVLLDVSMGGIDGIETARRITAAYPRPTVVLISVNDPDQLSSNVRTCGAVALVDKRDFRPALLAELWATHRPAA